MFYQFRQNNSGGSFRFDADAGISVSVIIEADYANEANRRAEAIGLYFDGAGDCDCCGDRWCEAWADSEGDEVPSEFGKPLTKEVGRWDIDWLNGEPSIFIHYKDGRVEPFTKDWKK